MVNILVVGQTISIWSNYVYIGLLGNSINHTVLWVIVQSLLADKF